MATAADGGRRTRTATHQGKMAPATIVITFAGIAAIEGAGGVPIHEVEGGGNPVRTHTRRCPSNPAEGLLGAQHKKAGVRLEDGLDM